MVARKWGWLFKANQKGEPPCFLFSFPFVVFFWGGRSDKRGFTQIEVTCFSRFAMGRPTGPLGFQVLEMLKAQWLRLEIGNQVASAAKY